MALTLTEAHWMVQAAVAKAQERNVTISVAVCDTGGTLFALHRMAGASAVRATVAHGKAAASADCGRPSGTVAADAAVLQAIIATLGGPAQGVVPVDKHGALVGARGGSGATAHEDEVCAQAGGAAREASQRRHGQSVLQGATVGGVPPACCSCGGLNIAPEEQASKVRHAMGDHKGYRQSRTVTHGKSRGSPWQCV